MTTAAITRPRGIPFRPASKARLVAAVVVSALLWELAGRAGIASGAFPPLSRIAEAWWSARDDYPVHVLATLGVSLAGFAFGNAVAIALAVVYQLMPIAERLLQTTTIVLFCMPIVVAAPILGVALPGSWPQTVLAALLVFFPTLLSTHLGLRNAPGDATRVVFSAGGGSIRQLLLVRMRAALPELMAGLQIAAPAAVLGAMLGEFLGSRHGLGIYLIGSMGRGDAAVVWAIGLTATALSAALYGLVGLVRTWAGVERARPVIDLTPTSAPKRGTLARRAAVAMGWFVAGSAVLLALWLAFIDLTGLPRTLMNGPVEVLQRLLIGPQAAQTRATVTAALGESLGAAAIGSLAESPSPCCWRS